MTSLRGTQQRHRGSQRATNPPQRSAPVSCFLHFQFKGNRHFHRKLTHGEFQNLTDCVFCKDIRSAQIAVCQLFDFRCSGIKGHHMEQFQSTHPVRGATSFSRGSAATKTFQSTHPVRGATVLSFLRIATTWISIHAPRAGCDVPYSLWVDQGYMHFNPRTPCGVRPNTGKLVKSTRRFQSTHPVRGATRERLSHICSEADFNPRTPCGVRLRDAMWQFGYWFISIHAPRAGCDSPDQRRRHYVVISIHAPRAGCDYHNFTRA